MNTWGSLMLQGVEAVAEMIAIGFNMPRNTFTELARFGPHLLAPTGSDLGRHEQKDVIFAGYHYDLNFLTIHGKSRFPGLYIWTRAGRRVPVRVPDGCLLVQAGKQLEWLTGGRVLAGFHEVVVDDAALEAAQRARASGRSLWRVSSTVFYHIQSDQWLRPLTEYGFSADSAAYPPMLAGDQVASELAMLKLLRTGHRSNGPTAASQP